MIINKLTVAGLRVFKQAKFEFQPGMNLIVGVNGVGKSTVLDALRLCLSRILPQMTVYRGRPEPIFDTDFRLGSKSMDLSCDFEVDGQTYYLLIHKQLDEYIRNRDPESERLTIRKAPDIEEFDDRFETNAPSMKGAENQPLVLFFSTRRSLTIDQKPASPQSGQAGAYYEAFSLNRSFNIREMADWLKVQFSLSEEVPRVKKLIEVIQGAVSIYLPGYSNLHVKKGEEGTNRLMIDKGAITLYVKQLSDGERGMLSIVVEIARRLALANEQLADPIKEGKGVILIDELDLHLHPAWQRKVVKQLTKTFPNCQFIVTTHSPQIISEVEHDHITIIDGNDVYKPPYSFGIDTNRVLDEIMDANSRNVKVSKQLSKLFRLIDEEDLDKAKAELKKVIKQLGEHDPEVTRARTLISFLEDEI